MRRSEYLHIGVPYEKQIRRFVYSLAGVLAASGGWLQFGARSRQDAACAGDNAGQRCCGTRRECRGRRARS